jgi:ribosome-binding factor A
MTPDKRTRAQMRAHCSEIHEDDGIDPRDFFRPATQRGKDNRKAMQLCRQVAETLEQVLCSEIADELVCSLSVTSVVPAPDSSRLLVTLRTDLKLHEFDRPELERRLEGRRGQLRCAVAGAITRRKTPNLALVIVGPDQAPPATDPEGEP